MELVGNYFLQMQVTEVVIQRSVDCEAVDLRNIFLPFWVSTLLRVSLNMNYDFFSLSKLNIQKGRNVPY